MKVSHYFLLSLVIALLAGCSNNQKNADNKAIIGIWQNTTNPENAIEFTRDGDYYIRMNGERLLTDDSIIEKYSFNPLSRENNLIIYGNPKAGNTQARLVVINTEQIKISLVHQGTVVSEAEFTKVKEQ